MNIILLAPVRALGNPGDVVTVKPGYARNYLIPQGLALVASPTNLKTLAARVRSLNKQLANEKAQAEQLGQDLQEKVVYLSVRAGEGKIYGAVTASDVVAAIQTQLGKDLDRRKLVMPKAVKEVGEYTFAYRAHHDVTIEIKVVISVAA